MFGSSQTLCQGILHSTIPSAAGAIQVQVSAGRPVANMKNELGSRLQRRCLKEDRQPWIPFCYWKFHRILWLDSKDFRYRRFFFLIPHSIINHALEHKIQNQVITCSDFPWRQCHGSKNCGWSIHRMKLHPREQLMERHFPNFEMLDARTASALNKIIQNSYLKTKVHLHNSTITSRLLALMIPFQVTLIYSELLCEQHTSHITFFQCCTN